MLSSQHAGPGERAAKPGWSCPSLPPPSPVTVLVLVPVQEPTVAGNWPRCNEGCCDEPIEDHRHFTLKTGLHSGHRGVLIMGEMLIFYVK